MKRIVIFLAIVLGSFSCMVQRIVPSELNGSFGKIVKPKGLNRFVKDRYLDLSYILQLNPDSTFILAIGREKCLGKWELVDDLIVLNCIEEDIFAAIGSGHMFQREHKLKIINRSRLKYNDVILKRNR
jgi:hypothetical protein